MNASPTTTIRSIFGAWVFSILLFQSCSLQWNAAAILSVEAWNPTTMNNPPITSTTTRRQWLAAGWRVVALTTSAGALLSPQSPATAACLPGDLSKECIGVYKVPIDDRILPYVSTREALRQFAPDMNYVPPVSSPDSLSQAWDILKSQRLAADDIVQVVQAGRLEEAGIKVLNLVPKITTSGKAILNDVLSQLASNQGEGPSALQELASTRLENQWNMALGLWGETDVMIGQALRGDMGVSAVAQIQLITQLKDATAALDDFLASAEAVSKSKK